MAAKISGGCICGAVRYECSADPLMSANCYCRDCQRASGGAFAPVLLVPKSAFKMTKGELKHYEVKGDSGGSVSRGFCANCGSGVLSLISMMPDAVALKAGCLDDPSQYRPAVNMFTASAPQWAPMVEGLPKFARNPG
jgi:hypothetical protein